jgi:CRISPR-associated protein Cas1
MASFARQVRSGDSTMMESQAAAFCFARVFGSHFRRSQLIWTNTALNYGYAILRGAIARGLVAHGFFPSIGLFHRSEQNAFNLADDMIEPFRPIVDLHVAMHRDDDKCNLSTADKSLLVALLNIDIEMPRGRMSVLSAIEQSIESLARTMDRGSEKLLELPTLIGLEQHIAEN